jgi:NitT/TauT family transport system substrate-binding protein
MKPLIYGPAVLGLLALGALPAAAADSPSKSLTPATLLVHWTPQSQFAGYYVAYEKGFYQKQGLAVRILRGGPDRNPLASLQQGEADFITMFLTGALRYRDQGIPVVNLAQIVQRSNLVLVARKDRGIRSAQDLQGKRVSLWGEDFRAAYLTFFQAQGVRPVMVPQYYSVNLFLRGGVDACAAMYYNEYHVLYQAGVDPEELTIFLLRDYGFGFPEDGIYCLESTLRQKPSVCRALAAASLEGWRYAAEHQEEALNIVMKYVREAHLPTNRMHMKWMLEAILPTIFPDAQPSQNTGKLSARDYARTVAVMREQKLIASAPSYAVFCGEGGRHVP